MMTPKQKLKTIEEMANREPGGNAGCVTSFEAPNRDAVEALDEVFPHRQKTDVSTALAGLGMVARSVNAKELRETPAARAAMKVEWDSLRSLRTWDESKVREWDQVAAEARSTGHKVHVGRIFGICVEKGSELPKGDPNRKFKGRVVFQGNNVKDEESMQALFNDLGSSPSTIAAGHFADFYGMLEGHIVQQADAVRAYTQAPLMGTKTWVRIPREEQPPSWRRFRDPVCPLLLALYGHPDSGSC